MNSLRIDVAQDIICEAEKMNAGLWIEHSKVVANCSKAIAEKCDNLDSNKAYVLGLLHDIGRREGVTDMRHIIDGYKFMEIKGYDECARIFIVFAKIIIFTLVDIGLTTPNALSQVFFASCKLDFQSFFAHIIINLSFSCLTTFVF